MELLAHSKNKDDKPQSFVDHTNNVNNLATNYAKEMGHYLTYGIIVNKVVECAAPLHDFGKLDDYQQAILQAGNKIYPFNHVDAGVAYCRKNGYVAPGILILGHHRGLPDFTSLTYTVRDKVTMLANGKTQAEHTDNNLDLYIDKFFKELPQYKRPPVQINQLCFDPSLHVPMTWRFALSPIIDADHEDTANYYGNEIHIDPINLDADSLLIKLDNYIETLYKEKLAVCKSKNAVRRLELRMEMYNEMDNIDLLKQGHRIVTLAAPVGSGKTYAAARHLLAVAKYLKLRRIFVVLPYTSIIDQQVKDYTKALVDVGIPFENIVTANHSKLEYDSYKHRHLSNNWKTQIIITTNNQFFETLASNKSRKLHYLAGSAIFCDEFHTLPLELWKLTFQWMKELVKDFGCYFILGSGTLIEAWNIKEFQMNENIPSLVSKKLMRKMIAMEKKRVIIKSLGKMTASAFYKRIIKHKTGCLLILNTLHNAALVAATLQAKGYDVEHLSTSVSPFDRKITLERILNKLEYGTPFFLVGTSCIEAGLDFSFPLTYRERCSPESLLQACGRTNRGYEYKKAYCYDFLFSDNIYAAYEMTENSQFSTDRQVVANIFAREENISSMKITKYVQEKFRIQIGNIVINNNYLLKLESEKKFKEMNDEYKIITTLTVALLVNKDIADRIKSGKYVSNNQLAMHSVNVYVDKLAKLNVEQINLTDGKGEKIEDIWFLKDGYEPFLGYMRALI